MDRPGFRFLADFPQVEVGPFRFLVGERIRTVSASSNRIGDLDFPKSKTTATVFQFENGAIAQTAISYEVRWPKSGQPEAHFLLAASRGVVYGKKVKLDEGDWVERGQLPLRPVC